MCTSVTPPPCSHLCIAWAVMRWPVSRWMSAASALSERPRAASRTALRTTVARPDCPALSPECPLSPPPSNLHGLGRSGQQPQVANQPTVDTVGSPTSQKQRLRSDHLTPEQACAEAIRPRRRPCAGRAALQDLGPGRAQVEGGAREALPGAVAPDRLPHRRAPHAARRVRHLDAELREALPTSSKRCRDAAARRWCLSPSAVAPNGSSGASSATRARAQNRWSLLRERRLAS